MKLPIDTTGWPPWAATLEPYVEKWGIVLLSAIAVWIVASLLRRLVLLIGKKALSKDKEFEGSNWDLAASITRVFALILLSPIPLGLAGYDWEAMVEQRGPGAIGAVAILVIAVIIANGVARSLRRFGRKAHRRAGADDTLFAFAASLFKYLIFAVAIVFALTQLGFPTASLAALLGAAGLAIGLALQDTLKAVAAGIMLAIFRPFRIGDYVSAAGLDGEVIDITPFLTQVKQIDNKIVSITNDKVWAEPLINHTRQTRRRLDLYFDISYDDDMDLALRLVREVADAHPRILANDDTWVGIHALASSSVQVRLRAYVATPEFIDVRADVTKAVKEAFDANGVTIPFQHVVYVPYKAPGSDEEKTQAAPPPMAPGTDD
ncbi:mechanosensitive ion channel family protein [Hyphomonas sp.]|jgi:small-conductance mechanosensitive channel|uniref:mechanosensitive ion channel family protein n=1 Tax=Hyphomonas sp. TaxID=87 RepID=UPI000C3EEFD1|nr:mechanosensitive ion channel family protein [Hyphomonas sp.]MAB10959.1 mechanosensitive ion channel protein MscS [Hyphomonas sp.]MAU66021.1 mechanosensitive ion channel protein MscS [Hyphomonas sp.]MBM56512.1 mechanosensitive ion channel protein MscS [Hyphomonas sp.]